MKFFLIFVSFLLGTLSLTAQDKFADIATAKYALRTDRLVEPQPPVFEEHLLPVTHDANVIFRPMYVMSTRTEMRAELDRMKERYIPFTRNLAPTLKDYRSYINLKTFDWRIETKADQGNFFAVERGEGSWEQVTVPHFGPPLGRAVTYYRKEVDISADMIGAGSLFLCFKGVDYRAEVYLNGNLAGVHTGFFAPFECDISKIARAGKNTLLVKVQNDYTTTGSNIAGENVRGNKIYAASGLGYDEPILGWHHCPPAMDIWQDCRIEARANMHVNDIFVRPNLPEESAEAWIEINNCDSVQQRVKLLINH